jgi:hypothetical protein
MKSLNQKVVILTVLILSAVSFAGTYNGGGGGVGNPYQISRVEDWQELMTIPADWNKHFILTADVNLAEVTLTPVGNAGTPFTGVFDGNDNIISNAVINQPYSSYIGLFGYVGYGGQIRNLGVENINVTGGDYVGGLVGDNYGTLTACYVTGSVTTTGTGRNVGGLVGYNNYGSISDCSAAGVVSGYVEVGGLVGWNEHGTLTACYATGSVSGNFEVGGLVGYNNYGSISDCSAAGVVSGTGSAFGGLVGVNYGSLTDCYATGSVSGAGVFGGLVGVNSGTLTDCYATGSVSGTNGGLVGVNNSGTITGCFWDTQTSGQPTSSGGGIGYPTAIMQDSEIYMRAFWDFEDEIKNGINDTWAMPFGGGYPVLAWQLGDSLVSNDEMSNAIAVTVGLVVSGTSIGATGVDTTHNGYKDNIDVWYIFTAPSNGDYVIGTLGSNFDTTLAVFDEDFIEIEFNDNYNCKQSKLTLRAATGVKYYIRIAGYNGQTGNYRLSVINDGPEPLMSDLNADGNVNNHDLAILAFEWLKSNN